MAPRLAVQGLRKSFAERQVLTELSFSVSAGEVYGLVGPNGSGKTTAINVICGLASPDAGEVTLDGMPITASGRRRFGIVPQEIALYQDLTCQDNLFFFGRLYGLRGEALREAAEGALSAVALMDRGASAVSTLSGGLQRRLHLAVALLHEPDILILDEPTVGLDLESRDRAWELIRQLKDQEKAILLTTHHLTEAEATCTRIGITDRGTVAAEGSLEELRSHVPAAELAIVEADDPGAVRTRAADLGMAYRTRGTSVVLWLPKRMDVHEVAATFDGVPLRSVTLKPVGLEEVYSEVIVGR